MRILRPTLPFQHKQTNAYLPHLPKEPHSAMRQKMPHQLFLLQKGTGKQWSEYLLCLAIPFPEYDLHRTKCSITCFIQTLHQFTFRPRRRIQGTPTIHIIISYHIALLAFLHSLNKSFTNSIQPTHPTPAKNTNPIRIIILFGLAARNGTVAGCTTVYTGVIS